MGLLETIKTKKKPCGTPGTFFPLCKSHGFIHACLLKKSDNLLFCPKAFAGYDIDSAKKSEATEAFWNGILPPCSEKKFLSSSPDFPLRLFLSDELAEKTNEVWCMRFTQKNTDYVFMAPVEKNQIFTPFKKKDLETLSDSVSYREGLLCMDDLKGISELSLVSISIPNGLNISKGSREYKAFASGVLERGGDWSCFLPLFTQEGLLYKAQFLGKKSNSLNDDSLGFLLGTSNERLLKEEKA